MGEKNKIKIKQLFSTALSVFLFVSLLSNFSAWLPLQCPTEFVYLSCGSLFQPPCPATEKKALIFCLDRTPSDKGKRQPVSLLLNYRLLKEHIHQLNTTQRTDKFKYRLLHIRLTLSPGKRLARLICSQSWWIRFKAFIAILRVS